MLGPRSVAARLLELRNQRRRRGVGLVLMYHEVGDGSGDPRRQLPPRLDVGLFRLQLAHLRRHYRIVPLAELRSAIEARAPDERIPVALTFDDDLPSHAETVVPILEAEGMPATFLLTGTALAGERSFWWQDLQTAAERGGTVLEELLSELGHPPDSSRAEPDLRRVARMIEDLGPEDQDRARAQIRTAAGQPAPDAVLDADGIRRIADGGFEIGFHTLRHHNLLTLTDQQLAAAMTEGRADLEAVSGHRPISIAYPHCRADRRVTRAARAAGFERGLVCDGAAVASDDDPLRTDRVDAWSESAGRFELQLARVLSR